MLYTSWSKPAAAEGYYGAEAALELAADPERWPAAAGAEEPLLWPRTTDIQTSLPKVLSTLWVTQPARRRGLERSLAEAGNACAAELGLTSAWTRRRQTGIPEVWEQARLPAGQWWLHHVSRHLEPHLHCHLLLPLRGRTERGARALAANLLHAGRYAAAARAAAVLAAHLRAEGFEPSAVGHYGWLTLRAGPDDCDIPHLHALAARWSTGRHARQTALATEAARHDSLSSDAVRKLDRLVVDRSARPAWRGVEYDRRYGQLLESHWLREASLTTERLQPPPAETAWTGGLTAARLYEVVSARDGRTDLRLLRERAWQLACHDPEAPATDGARAALVDGAVTECLAHRPVYAVAEVEGRPEPQTERAQVVGRGLVSIHWLAAADRLRRALDDDTGRFPRLMLTAGRGGERVYQPADGQAGDADWTGSLRGRVSALLAPAGRVQSDLLTQVPQDRIAYLAPPQGLDAAVPHTWLEIRRPLLADDPRRAAPPDGEPGLCVVAAQRRSDVELDDMTRRWRQRGWDVLLVIDAGDLANPRDTRSEALLWARRNDGTAALECRDMGPDPAAAYGRRHHLYAKLDTGRPSFWASGLDCHVLRGAPPAQGVAERLDALHTLNQDVMVVADADTLAALPPARWPRARRHTPRDLLKEDLPPTPHVVLALAAKPRRSPGARRLLLECLRLATHLSMVSPWEEDETLAWMQNLRLAMSEQRETFSDEGWTRLGERDRLQPLREPDRLHERLTGRLRY